MGDTNVSSLTLGWRLDSDMEPVYWAQGKALAGQHSYEDVVTVRADTLTHHTVLLAQSGSGKSFFLGRMLEEIALETSARVLILDPNADFLRIHETQPQSMWDSASYDIEAKRGFLPTEASAADFSTRWEDVSIQVRSARTHAVGSTHHVPLQVWWPSLPADFILEGLEPRLRNEVVHCHAFVVAVSQMLSMKLWARAVSAVVFDLAEDLLRSAFSHTDPGSVLRKVMDVEEVGKKLFEQARSSPHDIQILYLLLGEEEHLKQLREYVSRLTEQALVSLRYVSEDAIRYYSGRVREYQAAGILRPEPLPPPWSPASPPRIDVVDLPSVPSVSTRCLIAAALLASEWQMARTRWEVALMGEPQQDHRAPLFIVVDEAHNLIPATPATASSAALQEQFRTIAAEGRKLGMFLILVTQRPDKLDPLVLSECSNAAVMRIGSAVIGPSVKALCSLGVTEQALGVCSRFDMGRVLLFGPWAQESSRTFYAAARRTIEGGRSLRAESWAPSTTVRLARRLAQQRKRKREQKKPPS